MLHSRMRKKWHGEVSDVLALESGIANVFGSGVLESIALYSAVIVSRPPWMTLGDTARVCR